MLPGTRMMRIGAWFATTLLGAAVLNVHARPVMLAVIAEDPALQPATALLVAELSARDQVALVEREEIDRLRREQQLTLAHGRDVLRLGQMLGADGLFLLTLQKEGETNTLDARLIAVRPGVVLENAVFPWPITDLLQWSQDIVKHLEPSLPKLSVLLQDAVPVSIVNLRSAVQWAGAERTERNLTQLLLQRLSGEKEIFVLERRRMGLLAGEKEMQPEEPSPFWSGSFLLEGVVDKDGVSPETILVSARLVAPDRRSETFEASGPRENLAGVIESLARELLEKIGKTGSAPPWDAAAEAEKFLEEARWAMRWRLYSHAQEASESAWALGNRDPETARLRVLSYVEPAYFRTLSVSASKGGSRFGSGVFAELMRGVAAALENYVQATPVMSARRYADEWHWLGLRALEVGAQHLWLYATQPDHIPSAELELARLRQAAREVEPLLLPREGGTAPYEVRSGFALSLWDIKVANGWVWNETPREILADYRRLLEGGLTDQQRREFINRSDTTPFLVAWSDRERPQLPQLWEGFLSGQIASTNLPTSVTARMLRHRTTPVPELAERTGDYARVSKPFYDALLKHWEELICQHLSLLHDALDAVARRAPYFGPPLSGIPNVPREFRRQVLTAWVQNGNCLDPAVMKRVFRGRDFELPELDALLRSLANRWADDPIQAASWRREMVMAYLDPSSQGAPGIYETGPHFSDSVFEQLFRLDDYDEKQASALAVRLRVVAGSLGRRRPDWKYLQSLESRFSSVAPQVAPPPQITPAPQEGLLVSRWWQFPSAMTAKTQEVSDSRVLHMLYRENRLWVETRFLKATLQPGNDSGQSPRWVTETFGNVHDIDLETFGAGSHPFATTMRAGWKSIYINRPIRSFELARGSLYRIDGQKVFRWDSGQSQWTDLNLSLPGQMELYSLQDRIYFASHDTLLELDLETLQPRIMASARRRPAVCDQDLLAGFGHPRFLDVGEGVLHVFLGAAIHPWNIQQGAWGASIPVSIGSIFFHDGFQMLSRSGNNHEGPVHLWRIDSNRPPELLNSHAGSRPVPAPTIGRARAPKEPTPRWTTPKEMEPHLWTAPDGGNIWSLRWRKSADQPALLYFDDRWDEPWLLPVQFSVTHPFPGQLQTVPVQNWSLRMVPEGMVLMPLDCFGFWFIPRADLDAAIARQIERNPRPVRSPPPRPESQAASYKSAAAPRSLWADEHEDLAQNILRRNDHDGDGKLGIGEAMFAIRFEEALDKFRPAKNEPHASFIMVDPYDLDGDQCIDLAELVRMLRLPRAFVTYEDALQRFDRNGDGRIDGKEMSLEAKEEWLAPFRQMNPSGGQQADPQPEPK
jgi:Ca2+-binding EF-hand superfamily protein